MPVAAVALVVPASGDGPIADVSVLVGEKTLVLGGSYTGSYTVLASQDGGATFVPVATFDSDGSDPIEQTVPAAFEKMRVRANANTAPSSVVTCTVSGIAVVGANQFAVLASFPPGGGGSVVVDTYAVFPPTGLEDDVAILCSGGFVGTILVEGSPDASSWNAVGSFQAGPSPRPLVGLQAILEFAPLLTEDKVRYLRVSAQGQVQSTVVVTAGGSAASVAPPSSTTLAESYDNGLVAADQTIVLRDVFGGGVVVDATSGAFTGPNALNVLTTGGSFLFLRESGFRADSARSRAAGPVATWDAFHLDDSLLTLTGGPAATASLAMVRVGQGTIDGAGNTVGDAYDLFVGAAPAGSATLTRSWSAGFAGAVQGIAGLVLGAGLAPPTESDLVMGAGATVISEVNSGRLGYVAGVTQKFVVSMNGAAYVPLVTGDGTLAASYALGVLAADQTLALLDAKGGGVVVDGTAALFTGSNAFSVVVTGGATNFYRVGGFDVASTISKAAAAGTTWNEVSLLSSTLTLTGGPTVVTTLSMVRVGAGVINGAGNTVGDAYDLFVEAAPAGSATLTRSWSAGFAGAVQGIAGLVLGAGLAPPTESDLVIGAGATVISEANSGRLGYVAGATQQFVVSLNTGAYVPLLTGPAAIGFTVGSVPFGGVGGQLSEDNANFFWDNTNKRLGVGATPSSTLHVVQPSVNAAIPSAFQLVGGAHTAITLSTEDVGAKFDFSATKQWSTGALATQREILFQAPTYSFVGASVITTAATVAITGAPINGANATITNSYALWTQQGKVALEVGSLVSTLENAALRVSMTNANVAGNAECIGMLLSYVVNQTGTASGETHGLKIECLNTSVQGNNRPLVISNLSQGYVFVVDDLGQTDITQGTTVVGNFVKPMLKMTAAPNTQMVAGLAVAGAEFSFLGNKQWATGAISSQREFLIHAPTYTFVGASTITTAATVAITSAPLKGTNATLTNTSALLLQGTYTVTTASTTINELAVVATFNSSASTGAFNGINVGYTVNQTGTASGAINGLRINATETAILGVHNLILAQIGGNDRFVVNRRGGLTITQGVVSAATTFASSLVVTGGAHTNLTLSTEVLGISLNQSATKQWATGALATQREVLIQAPTYAFVGASVISTAATFAISGAPIAGANAAISNGYALWVQSGNTRLDGGQTIKGTDVNAAGPYVVTSTDYVLEVRYTTTGAISITLPALTGGTTVNGRIIIIKDSGYNVSVNNITLVLGNASDKIENANANFVVNTPNGTCLWLKANTTTNNWEFV